MPPKLLGDKTMRDCFTNFDESDIKNCKVCYLSDLCKAVRDNGGRTVEVKCPEGCSKKCWGSWIPFSDVCHACEWSSSCIDKLEMREFEIGDLEIAPELNERKEEEEEEEDWKFCIGVIGIARYRDWETSEIGRAHV